MASDNDDTEALDAMMESARSDGLDGDDHAVDNGADVEVEMETRENSHEEEAKEATAEEEEERRAREAAAAAAAAAAVLSATPEAGPGRYCPSRYCPPRLPPPFKPSFPELNGIPIGIL